MTASEVFIQQLITGLSNGMIIALIALGYTMVYGIIELINFAHGDLVMLGSFLALRTGSGEAVQGMFPLLFVFLFISSMNTPRDLIAVDWFRFLASINPVSYLIECVRSLIITGWDAEALALGFGVAIVIAVVSLFLASWAMKRRLTRT